MPHFLDTQHPMGPDESYSQVCPLKDGEIHLRNNYKPLNNSDKKQLSSISSMG